MARGRSPARGIATNPFDLEPLHACPAAGGRPESLPGACVPQDRARVSAGVRDYSSSVRVVKASLRDAAGAWPAALWLALAGLVAIAGGGGASSGGVALAAAGCRGACALAGVAAACGVRAWAPPSRRVIVYVAALAACALVSYASIAWSLTPQSSYGDANRWLVAAAAAAAGTVLAA